MSKRKKRTLFVALALLAAAAAAGVLLSGRDKPTPIMTALVERVPLLRAVVTASGGIRAKESVDIQAEIAGVIVDLPVREGDRVTKGQVLLRIDPFQTEADVKALRAQALAAEADAKGFEKQVATAQADLARNDALQRSAEADLVQAEANWQRAESSRKRKEELVAKGVISSDECERAQAEEKAARAQVDSAKGRVAQEEAQVRSSRLAIEQIEASHDAALARAEAATVAMRRAEDLLGKTTIRSPLAGVITSLNVEKGERAVPGILSNPQATLMTVADLTTIQAELLVDETDIVQISPEASVQVTVDALPEAPLKAAIAEIGNAPVVKGAGGSVSAASSSTQEGKDFLVRATLENPPASLRPGMSCEGEILTKTRENVLVVPLQALTVREVPVDEADRYLPPEPASDRRELRAETRASRPVTRNPGRRKELQGVFVKEGDGRVRFRPVKTGITGEMDAEVLEGLSGGEEIAIGPYKALRHLEEGARVEVDNSKFRRFAKAKEKPEES
ncbi:MAG TPA: HlyD family efflux transporter periplasmic adaptor subunit [Planctomycetota bacterium]|nr:HlyD family efflux transporter periplasmic adaptor subunit [Planctomycetota bacterium]